MISGASLGRGGDALGKHLVDVKNQNDFTHVGESRGLVTDTIDEQVRELTALVAHARTNRPLYHVHADPSTEWSDTLWKTYWSRFEKEFGLEKQPFSESVHTKHGRRHKHRVYSLVGPGGKTIRTDNDYARREKLSRIAEIEAGEQLTLGRHNRAAIVFLKKEGRADVAAAMEAAGLDTAERPEAPLTPGERAQQERTGVKREDVGRAAMKAWQSSKTSNEFQANLAYNGLRLARGKSAIGVVDQKNGFHPLRRLLSQVSQAEGGKSVRAKEIDALVGDAVLPNHDPDAILVEEVAAESLVSDIQPDPATAMLAPTEGEQTVDLSFLREPDWSDDTDRMRYLSELAAAESLRKEAVRVATLEQNPEALTEIQRRFGVATINDMARQLHEKRVAREKGVTLEREETQNGSVQHETDSGGSGGSGGNASEKEFADLFKLDRDDESRSETDASPQTRGVDGRFGDGFGPRELAGYGDTGVSDEERFPRDVADYLRDAEHGAQSGLDKRPASDDAQGHQHTRGRDDAVVGENPREPSALADRSERAADRVAHARVHAIWFNGAIVQQTDKLTRLTYLSDALLTQEDRAYVKLGRAEDRCYMIIKDKPWPKPQDLDPKAVADELHKEAQAKYDLAVEDAERLQVELDEARANFGWRRLLVPSTRAGFRGLQKKADEAMTTAFKLRPVPAHYAEVAKGIVQQRKNEQRKWLAQPHVQMTLKERGELERVRGEIENGNNEVIRAAADGSMVEARYIALHPQPAPLPAPQPLQQYDPRELRQ